MWDLAQRDFVTVFKARYAVSYMTVAEIREAYLQFFEERGHVRIPSASLVPENDPTTLFASSGMQPLVPYLLGQPHPKGKRLVNSQRSFRVKDIEEVGDNRHTTYFEMLGNWSLGDYFKAEQLPWIFEFLTTIIGLDPNRLAVTVFKGRDDIGIPQDDESVALWRAIFEKAGVSANDRIHYYDDKNWWSRAGAPQNMPVGEPGGPDSEIFWDFGLERGLHEQSAWKEEPCHVNCDCGRYLEIGNSVFMEYQKTEADFIKLPQQNVDFGGGLERIAAARLNTPDIFDIDVFTKPRATLEELSGKTYAGENQKAFRVILDHLRAATQLISDGVMPGNKDQGYVVRRLIRRAVRMGDSLGITGEFVGVIGEVFGATVEVVATLVEEETRFRKTLAAGLRQFDKEVSSLRAGEMISGVTTSTLYQSYGFPVELTQELARERGLDVDHVAFEKLQAEHQQKSRVGAEKKFHGGLADHSEMSVKYHTATHLLHKALQVVLGSSAVQRGSNITPERLRFDFMHPAKLSVEEIKNVEDLVNVKIQVGLPVVREELTVAEAKERGAMGLFEHKYGEKVSVYTMGDFSCEICGGPHVDTTGTLGVFKIIKEESVGVGVRRIKAVLL